MTTMNTGNTGHDGTDVMRKRAEETVHCLNRELRAISDCNRAVFWAVDEQRLLDDVCRIICDGAGYRMAWIGFAEHDESKTIRPAAWGGKEDGYLEKAHITWADTELGRGPSGTAIRSGKTIICQNFLTDPQAAPWREHALQRGYRSSMALALPYEKGNAFGVLNIYSTEPDVFIPEEARLLREMASNLAFGIIGLRNRTERKRAEEAFRESENKYRAVEINTVRIEWEGKPAALNFLYDITERKQIEDAQLFMLQCGWSASGEYFFESLARYLTVCLDMDYVCIDRLLEDGQTAQTVAIYHDGGFDDNMEYTLKDTPCGDVVGKTICCFPKDVRHLFPKDVVLQELMAESYVGTTLWSSDGLPIGLIAIIGRQPLLNPHLAETVLKIVAVSATGELERRRSEEALRERERWYRSLFEYSNDAIFIHDDSGHMLNVNKRAQRCSDTPSRNCLPCRLSNIILKRSSIMPWTPSTSWSRRVMSGSIPSSEKKTAR